MRLKTKYKIGEIPHMEHPCPQSMRKNWLCLNGEWDFYKENAQGEKVYEGKIIVPFSPETLNTIPRAEEKKSSDSLTAQGTALR